MIKSATARLPKSRFVGPFSSFDLEIAMIISMLPGKMQTQKQITFGNSTIFHAIKLNIHLGSNKNTIRTKNASEGNKW